MPEAWLRGPIDGVAPVLQPVAHALTQVADEAAAILAGFPDEALWTRPAGLAPVGFHLQHMAGVIDRLFTYAEGRALSPEQFAALDTEAGPRGPGVTTVSLVNALARAVGAAIERLRRVDSSTVLEARAVGRAGLPSTVLGLLVHAAEHSQRHLGQLLVTARVVREGSG